LSDFAANGTSNMTIPPSQPLTIRIGTRGSQLARWQAEWVAQQLRSRGEAIDLVEIATHGDVDRTRSIEEIGTRGVFTKAIQRALAAGDVDLGVHSLKDLPTESVDGLVLAAVPQRESPADVLVTKIAVSLERLPHGARVGTGSLRRQAQLRHVRPDLQIGDIRGNIDTRLRKLDEGQFDAIVLAEAGLRRLSLTARIGHVLPFNVMLPAVGQGALAIECRADDSPTRAAVALLDDPTSHAAVLAERALLSRLRGGCMAPVGAYGRFEGQQLHLSAVVLSADGLRRLEVRDFVQGGIASDAEKLGGRVADVLLAQGAAELIAESRTTS
jgi:hydroxymethylbilane synthase